MTHTSRRIRAALAAAAAVSLALLAPGTAGAAGAGTGTPTVPTDLYNSLRPCAADPAAPLVVGSRSGITVEGIAHHSDPSVTRVTEQFRYWPVSDPAQVSTVDHAYAIPGEEATAVLNPLADGLTYAWQARTVDTGSGAASDWSASCYVTADGAAPAAAPGVSSPNYPAEQWSPGGAPVQFHLTPNGAEGVTGYLVTWQSGFPAATADTGPHGIPTNYYSPTDDPRYAVRADADGSATVNLIPPPGAMPELAVVAVDRAGNRSPITRYTVRILSTSPTVTQLTDPPLFGKPTDFRLTPNPDLQAVSPVVGYTVRNTTRNTTTVVPAGPDGSAETTLVLNSPEGDRLEVSSTSANGWISTSASWGGYVDTTPTITSTDFPEFDLGGAVGAPGVFHLAPKVKGAQIASYTYSFGWGTEAVTVPAGPHGEADFTFTPTASGWYDLQVNATTKDGIRLSTGVYTFIVN
ncbi:hypothetical protein [Streptomyces sp. TLI_171]|uniref:hypothetical protein n=1 Tax=Streptomyces sp. TLI_171 TaxID=1938859 RepID=UPI000C18459C|nr:hypothetical protein [Streptomyces sp. TLI_171]RKE17410.1 hypothetical protein BX266_0666 [Streptomyces sp. TLI_171]